MIHPQLNKIAYELLRERNPNIIHLRVFCCKCFVLNNGNNNLGKFDARRDEGIFVGYVPNRKAYKVFNKRTKAVEKASMQYLMRKPQQHPVMNTLMSSYFLEEKTRMMR